MPMTAEREQAYMQGIYQSVLAICERSLESDGILPAKSRGGLASDLIALALDTGVLEEMKAQIRSLRP